MANNTEQMIDHHTDAVIMARLEWKKHKNFTRYQNELRAANSELSSSIEAEATRARIDALDHIIDLQDKQFNKWTQTDIANFFAGVGKYYRDLKRQAAKGEQ